MMLLPAHQTALVKKLLLNLHNNSTVARFAAVGEGGYAACMTSRLSLFPFSMLSETYAFATFHVRHIFSPMSAASRHKKVS